MSRAALYPEESHVVRMAAEEREAFLAGLRLKTFAS
jgi:hypothetical protein